MTISQAITELQQRIEMQKLMLNDSRTDGARMRCMNAIESYEMRIEELKNM